MKLLLAVDGSPVSARAVRHAIRLARQLAGPVEITLFHADAPVMQAVAIRIGADATRRYHEENARHATRAARTALSRAKLAFTERIVVAEAAEAILREAKKGRHDLIVMGTHGLGALRGLFLGSVASKVIAHADVPVTVVR